MEDVKKDKQSGTPLSKTSSWQRSLTELLPQTVALQDFYQSVKRIEMKQCTID